MAGSGFSVNQAGIDAVTQALQREFDARPIHILLQADHDSVGGASGATNTYHGPVFNGDANGAQLAWGNDTVTQTSDHTVEIAHGYEDLARRVTEALSGLDHAKLDEEETLLAREAGETALGEMTRATPDDGRIRRALATFRGLLAPVALAAQAGAVEGASEWARQAIEQLSS